MPTTITVREDQVLISLGLVEGRVADRDGILNIVGVYMYQSLKKTFREEGSPAGSWPKLAESTKKKKGYTAGHKLLIGKGDLFTSIRAVVANGVLIFGTGLAYAAVQMYGSADRSGGSIGAQARIAGRSVKVKAHGRMRSIKVDKDTPRVRIQSKVSGHDRFQNIPARPYLVIRPEDPGKWVSGIDAYLGSGRKAVSA